MQRFPFSAVISDLDGTLLKPDHRLGSFTIETIKNLRKRQIPFVVATGRPFADAQKLFQLADIDDICIITSNGARADHINGEPIFARLIDDDLARALTTFSNDAQVCVNTYEKNGWFSSHDVPDAEKFHRVTGFTYQKVDFHQHSFHKVEKVYFLSYDADRLHQLEQYIEQQFGDRVSYTYSSPHCLEIMAKGVSKASTLEKVLGRNILQNSVAFGDGLNDEQMLAAVKTGLVMGNADPRLLKALPNLEQIGNNGDEAVAHFLATCEG